MSVLSAVVVAIDGEELSADAIAVGGHPFAPVLLIARRHEAGVETLITDVLDEIETKRPGLGPVLGQLRPDLGPVLHPVRDRVPPGGRTRERVSEEVDVGAA